MFKRMSSLRFTVAVMVVALAGLIALQWHLLRQAMELKEQAFRRNALAALNTAAQKLEAGETYRSVITATMASDSNAVLWKENHGLPPLSRSSRPGSSPPDSFPLRVAGGKLVYVVNSPQWVRLQMLDLGGDRDTVVVDTFKTPGQYEVNINHSGRPANEMFYRYSIDSSHFYVQTGGTQGRSEISLHVNGENRRAIVNRAVDRLFVTEHEPIERRIRSAHLDSVLHVTFRDAGITIGYERAVLTEGDTTLRLVSPEGAQDRLRRSDLRAALFPADLLSPRSNLVVDFPGEESFVLGQVGPLFAATAILTLIIVWGFAYAVRTIVAQKRLAGLMTDFVNNMTHEFKTPISTVALAVEAIGRPEVLAQRDKVQQYNNVIRDETGRLRRQVERILEMATLERGEYELNIEPVNIHELLREVSAGVALQVAHRGGNLTLTLEAVEPFVLADRVHLTNIVNNLLDNGNKYSPGVPFLTLRTVTRSGSTVFGVTDKGIGIPSEHLGKVFEKYYRVPTGNRHDVKGFGLGLSYVKMMTEAMGGTVSIRSVVGAGTTVEVSLPGRKSS
ncbi:MAG: HAMP domain-containing sensor histidine kinase [Bacteroidota bacterium]